MGMEINIGCTNKEPDGVIVDSDGMSPIAGSETTPIHLDVLPNKSDLKGCTLEITLKNSEACQTGKGEEQSCPRIKVVNGYRKEKAKAINIKTEGVTREKASPKSTSKTCSTNGRINCTVPQPFSLATEKRASSRHVETETVVNKSPRKSKTTPPPNSGNKYQQNLMKKPLKSETKKHSDEEESSSVASDVSSPMRAPSVSSPMRAPSVSSPMRAPRSKTVTSAPVFKSMERAEKRKEFNSKLEEKQQALEAEKLQNEVRTKEEIEAAIKQLRRSMMFKASPLPNFYHEDPSRKHEGKKVPQTSTKSLELGRRKSCSSAVGLSGKRTSKASRYSLGIQKENPNSSDTNPGSSPNSLNGRTYGGDEELERRREFINRENNLEISVMS